ncbi:hypothetical protein M378DRAFT_162608, partial [Amanita muscaria Koide BX008]
MSTVPYTAHASALTGAVTTLGRDGFILNRENAFRSRSQNFPASKPRHVDLGHPALLIAHPSGLKVQSIISAALCKGVEVKWLERIVLRSS